MPQDTTRAERVRQLFDELIDLTPGERSARLGAVADVALRDEVEALLTGADEAPARLGSYEQIVQDYRHAVLDGTDVMPEPGRIVSRYELLERIGAGGMGVVFRARDTRLHRLVALKFLPGSLRTRPDARARFLREARAAALLDHPNICTVYEIDEAEDGHLFIAMALVEGETLKTRLARGPLPVEEATEVATRLASGLAYAHARGIVHRDVKPSNVVCAAGGGVKLLDFGIARMDDGDHTRTGTMLGTAAYMSPEQALGEEVDARSDVWALGVVLYELLTGSRPFHGDSELATVAAILHGTPRNVQQLRPDVPDALAAVVERALARAPADRFATMDEMEAALRQAQQAKVAPAPAGRWRGWPAALAGLGIAVLLALSLLWRARTEPAAAPHTLAVLYFDNLTGDGRLDWVEAGMVEMLTANLAQFDGLDVLSSQRLFDLVKQTSGTGRRVDQNTATQIARRAGVQTMILGSVLGDDASVRLNAQLVDVATGELIGTEVLEMEADASLFALTDSLTQRIAARLAVVPRGRPHGARVAYTLTGSPDALQHYVAGVQALYRANYAEAQDHFTRAIDADASFALAYYYRALAHAWETGDPGRPDLERALRYGDGLSRRERALVEATLTMSESLPTRKTAFERLVARYPDEKFARYQLGEIQYHNYWPRASVASFEAAVALDPHFLLAYLHPIDFYFHTDNYAAARPLVEAAYGLDSTNIELRLYRAVLDYAASDSLDGHVALIRLLQQVASDTSLTASARFHAHAAISFALYRYEALEGDYLQFREEGYYGDEGFVLATNSLAGLALVQGDLPGVEARLREARARYPDSPTQLYEEGLYRLMRGQTDAAEALARRILALHDGSTQPFPEVATLGRHLLFQAQLAGADEAGYTRSLDALRRQHDAGESEYGFLYRAAAGRLACAAGDVDEALDHFAAARERVSFTGTAGGVALLFSKLLLEAEVECLDRAGDYEAVVHRIEATPIWIHHYHDLNLSTMAAWLRSRLYLARAYEDLGRTDDALRRYQNVLGFWDEAPEVLPEIRQARARYERLAAQAARAGG